MTIEIFFDNDHSLVLPDQAEDVANELGHGIANRQNGVMSFDDDGDVYLVPIARILYVHVTEDD